MGDLGQLPFLKHGVWLTATILFITVGAPFAFPETLQGGETKILESKAVMILASEVDENVISDEEGDGLSRGAVPIGKEEFGEVRDSACHVAVENQTRWRVKIYVDGILQTTMDPESRKDGLSVISQSKLYAKTRSADALGVKWGPMTILCDSKSGYLWPLKL